jgi:hypothetical protein
MPGSDDCSVLTVGRALVDTVPNRLALGAAGLTGGSMAIQALAGRLWCSQPEQSIHQP